MWAVQNVGKTFMWYYLLKCILPCFVYSGSVSEANKNITAIRGADVILYCSLNGTFTLPEWHGPPGERIYTNQDKAQLNPDLPIVIEKRLDWFNDNNDHVNLIIKNVSDKDAGTYACIAGPGAYRFNLIVTELVVTELVTTTNSAPINMPKYEDSKEAPVWPAPVAIVLGGWLVICIVCVLYLVRKSLIKNDIFSKSIVSVVLLIVSCVFVFGWIYIICNCQNSGTNIPSESIPKDNEMLIKPEETPATRFIQDKKPIKAKGNISIYSLECTKATDASNRSAEIKKYVIGSSCESAKKGRTIMLVGAADTGKRTLIDGMVNYCMGVQFEHPFRLTFFEDKYIAKQVSNEGGWIAHYAINPESGSKLDYPLHIIDTKGYHRTDASGQNEKELIKNFLFGEIQDNENVSIDALCLLLKSTDTELTNQYNYLKSVLEILESQHHRVKIYYLITYADNDDVPARRALNVTRFPNGVTFTLNNSIIFNDKNKPDDVELNKQLWNKLERNFKSFFEFIDTDA